MKKLLILLLLGVAGYGWTQTNAPATNAPVRKATVAPQMDIYSDHSYFDDAKRQMIYYSHVVVKYPAMKLTCEQLTVEVPATGQPTNIVAETNVVVHYTDQKGQTNLLTAGKAVYSYRLVNGMTNELVTFTDHPRLDNAQMTETGEPFVWDNIKKTFNVTGGQTHFKSMPNLGTNGSPLNFSK
jgi:lipopolysaccharide transport protein LptA